MRLKPRQDRLARSRTAQTSLVQQASPGRSPIILTLLRVSPKLRSINRPTGPCQERPPHVGVFSRRRKCLRERQ